MDTRERAKVTTACGLCFYLFQWLNLGVVSRGGTPWQLSYAQVAATSKNELDVLKMDLSFNPFTASCRRLALFGVL